MMIEIAAILGAVAFAVLVGYLVPLLIQMRKTALEAEQLVTTLHGELPNLIADLREVSRHVAEVTGQARETLDHANGVLQAVGNVGDSVSQVQHLVSESGTSLFANAASLFAGFKAAKQVVMKRLKEGGSDHA